MTHSVPVAVKRLTDTAKVPAYHSSEAAGFDIHADVQGQGHAPHVIRPGERMTVSTGIAFAMPSGFYLRISPRSGLAARDGIDILAGVVDSDYRGEVKVVVQNHGTDDFLVHHGDRIAQGVITPIVQAAFSETDTLPETMRGEGGFGSTGLASATN